EDDRRGHQQLCRGEGWVVQRPKDFLSHDFRKHKAGHAMPHRQLTPEMLQEIRDLAAGWGKIVARRAFGDEGPGLDVDFDMLEQIARAAAAGPTEGRPPPAPGP